MSRSAKTESQRIDPRTAHARPPFKHEPDGTGDMHALEPPPDHGETSYVGHADQRKGRCGRLSDGVCVRLYSEEDFEERPRFTDPEILRTNLASVILQMAAPGLGDIADFPFLDPPDRRQVRDGIRLLQELAALDERSG